MTLTPSEQMANFASAIASECKEIRALINAAKEIKDSATGTGTTWSSSKISSELTAAKNEVKNDLLGGAGAAYDTLKELSDLIASNASSIEALEALAAGHVRFNAAQSLTDAQKAQARANIGAASQSAQDALDSRLGIAESSLTEVSSTANNTKTAVDELSATVSTKANDNAVVKLSGNQTIAGTKTFSSVIAGSISGNAATADSATKATQDASGNVITSTYLTKTDASKTYLGKTAKASSATTADSATKATQDASGNVITSTYATKASLASVATSGEYSDLSGVPTALKNPTALTLQNSAGTSIGSYDGSTATTVKLTASTVGLGNVTNESKATMLASAALTGTPTAPTATAGTNTTQVATTAFVTTAVANKTSVSGNAGTATKLATAKTIALSGDVSGSADFDGSEGITITATVADDSHNHVIGNVDGLQTALNAKAPLASPTFTGTPKAPTAAAGTNTTQVATTAFVTTAVANKTSVASATKATQDGSGNVITSTYATKTELTNGLSDKANTATTLAGYGITNAYTKSQTDSNFIGWDRGALDVDTLYNTGLYMVASGKNVPSGSNYGVVLTMPYQQMQGNTKTDFGAQIFLPNGDDNTHPNSMFFRTSLGESWNSWQEAATTAWVRTFVSNALSGVSGASVSQVGDIKLFHGSLGGSDGRRPVDGITGLADESWELCDGTNGTPDMRGQLAYGAGGTLAVGAAHGAPATSVDKAGFDYALGSRSGKPTTTVLTSTPQGVGLYYLKKTS